MKQFVSNVAVCVALLYATSVVQGQCYSHGTYSSGYSYSTPTYYQNIYTPYYVPTAVAYPVPYYGSGYQSDGGGAAKELKELRAQLELEKLKADILALKGQPVQQTVLQPPPPQQYAQPQQQEAAPPPPPQTYAAPQRQVPQQQECQTCKTQQQVPAQAPLTRQQAPTEESTYAPRPRAQRAMTRGQWVGQQACAACHTPTQADEFGGGHVFFKDDQGLTWNLRPRQLDRVIAANDKGSMPPKDSGMVINKADRNALGQHLAGLKQQQARRED